MCSFTVDQLFSPIPDAVANPLYKAERTRGCTDLFKVYTSKQCMNRVGCPTTTTTTTTTTTAPTIAVGDVRAKNGERVQAGKAFIPEVYYDGKYSPICGHYFWDDNQGAENVCKRLGFFGGGKVKRTNDVYDADAMPVGRCKEGESLDKCSAGGNAFGDLSKTYGRFGGDSCRKGQRIGVNVVCEPTIAVGDVRAKNGERVQAGKAFIPEVYYDGNTPPSAATTSGTTTRAPRMFANVLAFLAVARSKEPMMC